MNEPRRDEARPLVRRWGQFFTFGAGQRKSDEARAEIGIVPTRTCADGKLVPLLEELRGPGNLVPQDGAIAASPSKPGVNQKDVRDVGAPGKPGK
jgi:hypothetical protein